MGRCKLPLLLKWYLYRLLPAGIYYTKVKALQNNIRWHVCMAETGTLTRSCLPCKYKMDSSASIGTKRERTRKASPMNYCVEEKVLTDFSSFSANSWRSS